MSCTVAIGIYVIGEGLGVLGERVRCLKVFSSEEMCSSEESSVSEDRVVRSSLTSAMSETRGSEDEAVTENVDGAGILSCERRV
jgi:hypothetical protein